MSESEGKPGHEGFSENFEAKPRAKSEKKPELQSDRENSMGDSLVLDKQEISDKPAEKPKERDSEIVEQLKQHHRDLRNRGKGYPGIYRPEPADPFAGLGASTESKKLGLESSDQALERLAQLAVEHMEEPQQPVEQPRAEVIESSAAPIDVNSPEAKRARAQETEHRTRMLQFLREDPNLTPQMRKAYSQMTTAQLEDAYDAKEKIWLAQKNSKSTEPKPEGYEPRIHLVDLPPREDVKPAKPTPELSIQEQWDNERGKVTREMMKELLAQEKADWQNVSAGEKNLEKKHSIRVITGSGTQEQNLKAQQKMEELLGLLPNKSYKGKNFKPVFGDAKGDPIHIRPDGTVEFNANVSAQELHDFYATKVMGIKRSGPETKNSSDSSQIENVKKILDKVEKKGTPAYASIEMIRALEYMGMPLAEISSKTPKEMVDILRAKYDMNPFGLEGKDESVKEPEPPKTKTGGNGGGSKPPEDIEGAMDPFDPVRDPFSPKVKKERLTGLDPFQPDKEISQFEPKPILNRDIDPFQPDKETSPFEPKPVLNRDIDPFDPQAEVFDPFSRQKGRISPELKQRVADTREKYLKAKAALDEFGVLKHLRLGLKKDAKERVQKAFEEAEQEYATAHAEYVNANADRYLEEQKALNEAKFKAYGFSEKKKPWLQAVHELGNYSLYDYVSKRNPTHEFGKIDKFLLKRANVRMLINGTLLGTGLYAGAGLAGASIFTMKRAYSSLASGFGSRGLLETYRKYRRGKKNASFTESQIDQMTDLDEVESYMTHLQVTGGFEGKTGEEIFESNEYKKLLDRQKELMLIIESNPAAAQIMEDRFKTNTESFSNAFKAERSGRRKTAIAGTLIAGAVGGGLVGRGINKLIHKTEGLVDIAKSASHAPEIGQIKIGGSGIEGSLTNLKESDPSTYSKMIKWLHNQYPDSKAKDSTLIHRMVKKIGQDKGYTMGEGGYDLNKISSGNITMHSDGSFSLDQDKINFVGETAPTGTSAGLESSDLTEATPSTANGPVLGLDENGHAIISEQINPDIKVGTRVGSNLTNEVLDFDKLQNKASAVTNNVELPKVSGISRDLAEAAPEVSTEIKNNFLYEQASKSLEKFDKTTEALRDMLKGNYNKFMNEQVMLDSRELNKIQNDKITDIIKRFNDPQTPEKVKKMYSGLFGQILEYNRAHAGTAWNNSNDTVRKFLIRLAWEKTQK